VGGGLDAARKPGNDDQARRREFRGEIFRYALGVCRGIAATPPGRPLYD
jgi:hypothetical protein